MSKFAAMTVLTHNIRRLMAAKEMTMARFWKWLKSLFVKQLKQNEPTSWTVVFAGNAIEAIDKCVWRVGRPWPEEDSPWLVKTIKAREVTTGVFRVDVEYQAFDAN